MLLSSGRSKENHQCCYHRGDQRKITNPVIIGEIKGKSPILLLSGRSKENHQCCYHQKIINAVIIREIKRKSSMLSLSGKSKENHQCCHYQGDQKKITNAVIISENKSHIVIYKMATFMKIVEFMSSSDQNKKFLKQRFTLISYFCISAANLFENHGYKHKSALK
jgi:hypothetical protein